jgi:hypothetical protein
MPDASNVSECAIHGFFDISRLFQRMSSRSKEIANSKVSLVCGPEAVVYTYLSQSWEVRAVEIGEENVVHDNTPEEAKIQIVTIKPGTSYLTYDVVWEEITIFAKDRGFRLGMRLGMRLVDLIS